MANTPTSVPAVRTLAAPSTAPAVSVAQSFTPGAMGRAIIEVPGPLQTAMASDAVQRGIDANNARLAACSGHKFIPRTYDHTGKVVQEYQCPICSGVVTPNEAYWYNSGKKDGLIDAEIDGLLRLLRSADQNIFSRNITLKLQRMRNEMKVGT